LTASNLGVDTTTGQATTSPPPDAQFSSYPSTPPSGGGPVDTVLLPGGPGQGSSRFVVGPPALTQQAVTSARAARVGDIWVVDLTLSPTGSAQWDRLAQQQFHAVVAVVEDGRVLSAPLIEPVQTAFSTFAGHLQVSGISTEGQARALAAGL
jgi:preprotein translocase subunit SecD